MPTTSWRPRSPPCAAARSGLCLIPALDEHGDHSGQRSCSVCGALLRRRPPGSPGRRAKYCTHACRQKAHRRRKGGRPSPVISTAADVLLLGRLEMGLLQNRPIAPWTIAASLSRSDGSRPAAVNLEIRRRTTPPCGADFAWATLLAAACRARRRGRGACAPRRWRFRRC